MAPSNGGRGPRRAAPRMTETAMKLLTPTRPQTAMARSLEYLRRADFAFAAGLGLLALGLRLHWAGSVIGESDCARFLIGIRQWFHLGPAAAGIYDKTLCPGFYRLAMIWLHAGGSGRELAMISALLTASATLPVYWMGRMWLRPLEAVLAATIWMLAPGWWWLGIEVHPEAWALAAGLWALWAWTEFWSTLRDKHRIAALEPARQHGLKITRAWIWLGMAFGLLTLMLLLDAGLAPWAGAFWGVSWIWTPRIPTGPALHRGRLRGFALGLAATAGLWAGAAGGFVLIRRAILGNALAPGSTRHALARFWQWPHGTQWLKQLLPLATGLGLGSGLFIALGVLFFGVATFLWTRTHRITAPHDSIAGAGPQGLWLLCLCWSLPGWIFWLMVRGNNVRHVVVYSLPWIWLGVWGWKKARRGWKYGVAAGLLAANFWLIPANSNVTLYPSGNVPASRRDFLRKQAVMRQLALRMARDKKSVARGPVCYLGLSTNPYLENTLLRQPGARLLPARGGMKVVMAEGQRINFFDITSAAAWRGSRARCASAYSLEFELGRKHLWFMGNEWRHLPEHRRWYAAASAPPLLPSPRIQP